MKHLKTAIVVGLIGDFSEEVKAHSAISKALALAASVVGCEVSERWIPTPALAGNAAQQLAGFEALWCAPGSPYANMEGALDAIRFAREQARPFLGTCGGFQHTIIEYARNVLGLRDADHAESNPEALVPIVSRLACSLVGVAGAITLRPGSHARTIWGREEIVEQFHCNFGVNPKFQSRIEARDLRITGVDSEGGVRIVELPEHPFFLATLFQPEMSAFSGVPHPLIVAFVRAAARVK